MTEIWRILLNVKSDAPGVVKWGLKDRVSQGISFIKNVNSAAKFLKTGAYICNIPKCF